MQQAGRLAEIDAHQHARGLAARHGQERVRLLGREVADRRAGEVHHARGPRAGKLQRMREIAVDRNDLEPGELAPEALRRTAQCGLRNVDREVRRRTQRADQEPGLQALSAAVLDKLAPASGEAHDRGDVRAGKRELGARQIVLGQPADALEQAAAGVVVEILRRQRLLWQRQPGDHIVEKVVANFSCSPGRWGEKYNGSSSRTTRPEPDYASPMRETGRWPISCEMRSAVSLTSGPHCSFIRSAGEESDRAATSVPLSSRIPAATQRTPISASSLSVAQPWRWIFSRSRSRTCTLESVFLVCGERPVRFA